MCGGEPVVPGDDGVVMGAPGGVCMVVDVCWVFHFGSSSAAL